MTTSLLRLSSWENRVSFSGRFLDNGDKAYIKIHTFWFQSIAYFFKLASQRTGPRSMLFLIAHPWESNALTVSLRRLCQASPQPQGVYSSRLQLLHSFLLESMFHKTSSHLRVWQKTITLHNNMACEEPLYEKESHKGFASRPLDKVVPFAWNAVFSCTPTARCLTTASK